MQFSIPKTQNCYLDEKLVVPAAAAVVADDSHSDRCCVELVMVNYIDSDFGSGSDIDFVAAAVVAAVAAAAVVAAAAAVIIWSKR